MENITPPQCPKCKRLPHQWKEQPLFGSRELYWIGCKVCGLIAGAITKSVVAHSWRRVVDRERYAIEAQGHAPLQFGRMA